MTDDADYRVVLMRGDELLIATRDPRVMRAVADTLLIACSKDDLLRVIELWPEYQGTRPE